jgi:hypothetical protein
MDTSPEYTKMCEKAKEIQTLWNPKEGDVFFSGMFVNTAVDYENWSGDVSYAKEGRSIWLPRQDQLQGMVDEGKYLSKATGLTFYCNVHSSMCPEWEYYKQFLTMEQLWLAFVMKEKFNKTWDGTDWVKE